MKTLLLEIHGMKFYTNNTVDIGDLDLFSWFLKNETIYVSQGDEMWPIDMVMTEKDRCNFYAELFYAVAEQELLS